MPRVSGNSHPAASLHLEGVTKRYPASGSVAVDDLTLDVAPGEVCVLIGPSGCGKTTALRMVNRLIEPTSGRITIDGTPVTTLSPPELRRRIGYVIQEVGLLPHLTVASNVATVPRLLGWERDRVRRRVDEMLELIGLPPGEFASRYPAELSGGQQQRVGLARALAADPPVMLMDEPFSAVDPVTRQRLQADFLALQRHVAKTVVFVTHDIDEAVRMADRVAIMRAGRVVQYATPDRLLANPADDFVTDFVGADRALKRLGLIPVGGLPSVGTTDGDGLPLVDASASVRDALSLALENGAPGVTVADGAHRATVTLEALLTAAEPAHRRDHA